MAINRKDYQYIRNTLPTAQTTMKDGDLQFGDVVRNLMPEIENSNSIKDASNTSTGYWYYNSTANSVKNGELGIKIHLKPGYYALQVVNACYPYNLTEKNTIVNGSITISFDDYVYFKVNSEGDFVFKINGLSFGYSLFSWQDDENELRSFITDVQAKVFLFETKNPWMVDFNGVINGTSSSRMYSFIESSSAPVTATGYTESELSAIYSQAPVLSIDSSGALKLSLVLPINKAKWENTEVSWKENVCLLVYKDALMETSRGYRDRQNSPHSEVMRYGLIRTIQNTRKSQMDSYFCEVTLDKVLHKSMIDSNDDTKTPLESCLIPTKVTAYFDTNTANKEEEISLGHMVSLGSNKKYCNNNDITDRFEYTSVAFAWGYCEKGKWESGKDKYIYTCLSDYSIPLILSRNFKVANYSITPDGSFEKNKVSSYYPHDHYYFG